MIMKKLIFSIKSSIKILAKRVEVGINRLSGIKDK
jgi:hypothetical protein